MHHDTRTAEASHTAAGPASAGLSATGPSSLGPSGSVRPLPLMNSAIKFILASVQETCLCCTHLSAVVPHHTFLATRKAASHP